MPCRNLCRLYIHLAFTYSVGPSSVVWSKLDRLHLFHQWECLKCKWSWALSLMCEVALRESKPWILTVKSLVIHSLPISNNRWIYMRTGIQGSRHWKCFCICTNWKNVAFVWPTLIMNVQFFRIIINNFGNVDYEQLWVWWVSWPALFMYSGVTPKLAPCAIPEDSAHTAANFDTLPSAGKLLFIYEILDTIFLLCWQHVYQISKLEDWWKKDIQDLLTRGSCKKCFTAANFDTLPRIEEIFFPMEFLEYEHLYVLYTSEKFQVQKTHKKMIFQIYQ
jgi:hypothetical protein